MIKIKKKKGANEGKIEEATKKYGLWRMGN